MKEKNKAREERNKERLTHGDWVMAEFYEHWQPENKKMHHVIDEFKKLMEGTLEVVPVSYTHLEVYKRQYHNGSSFRLIMRDSSRFNCNFKSVRVETPAVSEVISYESRAPAHAIS